MDDYSISYVRQSLIRPVIMGNMPAMWFWVSILSTTLICFIMFILSLWILFFLFIFIGTVVHLLLNKAFSLDDNFFKVFIRQMSFKNYYLANSRSYYFNHSSWDKLCGLISSKKNKD